MKLIFIWIPKNAGTSFYNAMTILGMKQFINFPKDFDRDISNIPIKTFGHIDTIELMKMGILTWEDWNSSNKVCIVRNPYTRFLSLYKDFVRSKRFSGTIHEFANVVMYTTCKPGIYNVMDYSQCAPQNKWVLPGVEIMRFENIVEEAKKKFGVDMKHLNKSEKEIELPHHVMTMINDIYAEDFILFKYKMKWQQQN